MKVLLRSGVLDDVQKEMNLTDQQFAEFIGISRSQLWRAKMPASDKRFSLGNDFVAAVLNALEGKKFEELFFLGDVSHECDRREVI